ncbi:MAG: protein kinase [Polyangiaceae bacterium]
MSSPDPARTIGRYRLEERIGEGSFAETWRAKSFGVEGFEKTLVIKRLLPALARDPVFVERFIREAQLAVRLSHANVVQVFDLGKVEEGESTSVYLAMEHVAGSDLEAVTEHYRRTASSAPLRSSLFVASRSPKRSIMPIVAETSAWSSWEWSTRTSGRATCSCRGKAR